MADIIFYLMGILGALVLGYTVAKIKFASDEELEGNK